MPDRRTVPPKSHPKWAALVEGRINHQFKAAAASMLLFQLRSDLKRDASPNALAVAINKLHAFCLKYERMMQEDIQAIFN